MKNTKENKYLYYVDRCYDLNKQIKEFYPKVPFFRMKHEDSNTSRICLGESIDSCFSAASFSEDLEYQEKSIIYCLYLFDKNDILPQNFYDSDYLFSHKLVPDSYLTKECWVVNQNLRPCEILYFTLKDFSWSFYPLFETIEEYHDYENGKSSKCYFSDGIANIKCIEDVIIECIEKKDICKNSTLQLFFKNTELISKNKYDIHSILFETLEGFQCTYQVTEDNFSLWIIERENERPFSQKKLEQSLSEYFESEIEII